MNNHVNVRVRKKEKPEKNPKLYKTLNYERRGGGPFLLLLLFFFPFRVLYKPFVYRVRRERERDCVGDDAFTEKDEGQKEEEREKARSTVS